MTTTHAVAARRADQPLSVWPHRSRSIALVALAALAAAGLGGCSGGNLLGNSSSEQTQALAPPVQVPAKPAVSQSKVALATIVGAPDAINKQLTSQLTSSLQKQNVAVAAAGDKADFTLRGYMVAAKEKTNVKVSYIWDLTDGSGKRANRIQGEEFVNGGDAREPWGVVTEQLTQTVADKTASQLAASLPGLTAVASNSTAPVGVGAPAPQAQQMQTASLPAPGAGAARGAFAGTLVSVGSGAPGDGNTSLMAAMRDELVQAGVTSSQPGQPSYTVVGKVTVGAVKDGKQSIRIDWKVSDPTGVVLATVSQNNDIPSGALNGPWGSIANDAAQGAAVKIKTLIEENQSGASASRGPVRREVRSKT